LGVGVEKKKLKTTPCKVALRAEKTLAILAKGESIAPKRPSRGHRETQTTARFAAAGARAYPKGQVTAPGDHARGPGEQRALGTSYCNAASTFREIGFVSQICRTVYAAFTVSRCAFFLSPPPRCSLPRYQVDGHYLSGQGRKLAFCGRRSRNQAKVRFRQLRPRPRKRQTWCCSGTRLSFIYYNLVRAA
jgi:hypothetical protein